MNRNLIMSVAKGYNWHDLEPFMNSFNQNCPSADIVLFVDDVSNFTMDRLKNSGVNIQPIPEDLKSLPIVISRLTMYKNFIDAHNEYNHVFLTDIRDVIFQGDLFSSYSNRNDFLIYATEGQPINNRTDNINELWLTRLFNSDECQKIADRTIICAGTVYGACDKMKIFLEQMNERLRDSISWGDDQAMMNYLIHNKLLPIENILESSVQTGEILCTFYFDNPIRNGKILRGDGGIPAVVHQYDRHAAMLRFVEENYHENDFRPNENFIDTRSVIDQVHCLIHRQNWRDATKLFINHVLYSDDLKNHVDRLIKIWQRIIQRSTQQNFAIETLTSAVQKATIIALETNINIQQMESLYALFDYSAKNLRTINPSLKIFVVSRLMRFVDIFYKNGQRDWSLKYLERVTEIGLPVGREVYLTQAKIYRETGNKSAALAAYEKALNAT